MRMHGTSNPLPIQLLHYTSLHELVHEETAAAVWKPFVKHQLQIGVLE